MLKREDIIVDISEDMGFSRVYEAKVELKARATVQEDFNNGEDYFYDIIRDQLIYNLFYSAYSDVIHAINATLPDIMCNCSESTKKKIHNILDRMKGEEGNHE